MTLVADIDLRDTACGSGPVLEPTRYLVRLGPEVLGSALVAPHDLPGSATVRDALLAVFADEVRVRTVVPPPVGARTARDVTVVVCTRDRPDLLRTCLQHLAALDPAPGEVIVVDNASRTADSRRVAEAAGVRCVGEPRPGLNRARELGWRSARTPVVAYVDDDARVDRHYAAAVAAAFLHERVGAVTGLVEPAELATPAQRLFERQGGMGKGYRHQVHSRATWTSGVQPYRLGVGTAMAFRLDALRDVAGFDPRLDVGTPTRGGGDLDALFRTLLAGWDVVYSPDAVVRHQHRRDWTGLLQQVRDNGRSFSALLALYEQERPELAAAARRERRRWHWSRHVRGVLGAARRRDGEVLLLLLAEAWGSRSGRRALAEACVGVTP